MSAHNTPSINQQVASWARGAVETPSRSLLASAVRETVAYAASLRPGKSVELRVPPFAAAQLIDGPAHKRGTPPNVVEVSPKDWILCVLGEQTINDAASASLSGTRAGEVQSVLDHMAG